MIRQTPTFNRSTVLPVWPRSIEAETAGSVLDRLEEEDGDDLRSGVKAELTFTKFDNATKTVLLE